LGRGGGDRRWVVDGEQRRSEHGIDGDGALVGSGRGGEVCELCEDEAAEEVGNGGSMVSFELAGVWAERLRCSGFFGLGASE